MIQKSTNIPAGEDTHMITIYNLGQILKKKTEEATRKRTIETESQTPFPTSSWWPTHAFTSRTVCRTTLDCLM